MNNNKRIVRGKTCCVVARCDGLLCTQDKGDEKPDARATLSLDGIAYPVAKTRSMPSPLSSVRLLLTRCLLPFALVSGVWAAPLAPAKKTPAPMAQPMAVAAPGPVCDTLLHRLPNVSRALCLAAGLQAGAGRSVQGVPLYWRDIEPEGAKLRVLVMGGIHGDELSSGSLALHWIAMAQQPTQMPQPVHWRFIPVLNPDGVMAQPPRRVNANGVDLNRNFPTPNWERDAAVYWEQRTRKDPRRWPGRRPLSEPETRYLHEQMQSFKPHLIVAIHAPYGVLDFDGPTVPPSKLGRLYLDQVGIFPGSLGNYGGVHKGVPVVTIELPNAMRTPLDAEMRQMWLDLLRWMSEKAVGGLGTGR